MNPPSVHAGTFEFTGTLTLSSPSESEIMQSDLL